MLAFSNHASCWGVMAAAPRAWELHKAAAKIITSTAAPLKLEEFRIVLTSFQVTFAFIFVRGLSP
jgi:hypothetical protein